jgi:menaquinone-dependent protoporphyrinogen oxidase
MARWRRDAVRLLHRRRKELARLDVWLFSSGPVGEEKPPASSAEEQREDRWTKPKRVERVAGEIGARDHAVFGGRVSDDAGVFMRTSMAKKTPHELRDRRDWSAIDAWTRGIAVAMTG